MYCTFDSFDMRAIKCIRIIRIRYKTLSTLLTCVQLNIFDSVQCTSTLLT